jgi:zinc protease
MMGRPLLPTRVALANGVVVLAKETRRTPAVSMNLAVRTGSVDDPVDAQGSMSLLSRVIDRGTVTRGASDIAEMLDSRGISLSVYASRHLFGFVCTCLADDFEPVLALVGEVVMSPTIPESELETRKGEAVTAIRQDEDNPYRRATDKLVEALYGSDHPYGWPLKGTIDAVERTTRERLVALHAGRFAPALTTAVIVGDVETSRAVDAASRVFAGWRRPTPIETPLPRPAVRPTRRRLVVPMMNKSQADIAYGFIGVRRSDPEFYASQVMNNVLGEYALGGRLGDSIRERQGMAYYVSSVLEASVVEGPLLIRAGVSPQNVDRGIDSIDEELARFLSEGISERELDESRHYLIGSMPRLLETDAGIASFLQTSEFFKLGLDHDQRIPDLLRAVTRDQVHAAAKRILDPQRATIVIAGPYQEP